MPISDWLDLMPATVSYRSVTGRDEYGKASLGTAVSYRARVEHRAIRTSNRVSGQEEIAAGCVWLAAAIYPGIDDQITLPDGKTPVIINWDTVMDEEGVHHTKIFFGGAQIGVNK